MRITRRTLLLTAVGVGAGCESRVAPDPAPGPPGVPPSAYIGYLSVERSRYHGVFDRSVDDQVINEILLQRADQNERVICQMIARPSERNESAIYLRHGDAGWQLMARSALVSLERSVHLRLNKGMDPCRAVASLNDSVEESVRPISDSLAGALQRVWTEMLLRTRPRSMPEVEPDASTYSFAHHHLAGVTILESKKALAGRLVSLGKTLREATTLLGAKHQAMLAEVSDRATVLLKDLSQLPDAYPDKSSWDIKKLYGELT
jgi:hypothetical protein